MVRSQHTPVRMANIKNTKNLEPPALSYVPQGNVKWYSHSGKQFGTLIHNCVCIFILEK